jgi:hypothetical protein
MERSGAEMEEHRTAGRRHAFLKAEIRYNNGLFTVPCIVRDISDTGARIELHGTVSLPKTFDIFIEKRNQTRPASVRWIRGNEVGIAFTDAQPAADPAAAAPQAASAVLGNSDLAERVAKLEGEVAELRSLLEKIAVTLASRA